MNETWLRDFPAWSAKLEGMVPYMYLDVKGIVTYGIGHAAFSPDTLIGLPWHHKDTDVRATEAQIRNEWAAVRDNKTLAKNGHLAAAGVTRLRLTADDVYEDTRAVMRNNHADLLRQYKDMDSWPLDAIWATHSMAWACGTAFSLPGPYRFTALAKKLAVLGDGDGDFAAAAIECHMNEAGNAGLIPRNKANKIMYRNAQVVRDTGLDPSVLYWPKELDKLSVSELEELLDSQRSLFEPVQIDVRELDEQIQVIHDMNSYFPERNDDVQ